MFCIEHLPEQKWLCESSPPQATWICIQNHILTFILSPMVPIVPDVQGGRGSKSPAARATAFWQWAWSPTWAKWVEDGGGYTSQADILQGLGLSQLCCFCSFHKLTRTLVWLVVRISTKHPRHETAPDWGKLHAKKSWKCRRNSIQKLCRSSAACSLQLLFNTILLRRDSSSPRQKG